MDSKTKAAELKGEPGSLLRFREIGEMNDEAKTKEQLIRELVALRQRIVGLQEEEAERKREEAGVRRHAKQLEALYTISQTVSRTLGLHELLSESLIRVLKVMDADAGGIYLLDLRGGELILKAHSGVSEAFVGSVGSIKLEQEGIKRGLKWQQPAFEPDTVFAEGTLRRVAVAMEGEGLRVQIAVPFGTESVPLGALVVASRRERQFSAEDISLLQAIGNEIALGIENAMLVEKTRELAITDELTGLYNRRHFYEVLEAETHRTRRHGNSFSLIMLDLDGLKGYNDRFGHVSGDAVLQSLAQTIKSTLRKSDTAFRYGGDEFTIILPETHANMSKMIVDRIRSKWLRILKAQCHLLDSPLGFSAGIAQFPEHAETADDLVFLADATLYRAKRQGGCNCTLVCDLQRLSPDARIAPMLDPVYAVAGAVDAKDPHTYGHSKRVAAISEMNRPSYWAIGKGIN
jgi:diguanylate cyclase (GGDEF)-like protein